MNSTPLQDSLVYWVNGLLLVAYALWRIKFTVTGAILALIIAGRYTGEVAHTSGDRPLRYGRGSINQTWWIAWRTPLITLAIWAFGSILAPTDIENIWSVVMWGALLAVLPAVQGERGNTLFRHQWMMALYGLMMVGMRVLIGDVLDLGQTGQILHLGGSAAAAFTSARASLTPWAAIIVWAIYPIGYIGLLWQRFQINRGALTARGQPRDVMNNLVNRGEDSTRNPRFPIPPDRDNW